MESGKGQDSSTELYLNGIKESSGFDIGCVMRLILGQSQHKTTDIT
jgi:hypothetical protein